ncbi:MAG: L(+)-tartrate dehydratase subunit beta [Treponema sp.]|nr:L(+)-tartrate dehydratase subunit beta [Treponema sp.]
MRLSTPLQSADLEGLCIGNIMYLDGVLVTARDDVHHRHLRQGVPLPVDLAGGAIFHAGPIMQKTDTWRVVSIGPTTSMRMEQLEAEFIVSSGVKLIVGKGGMGAKTAEACRRYGAVHAVFPGGCAVLAADRVEEVERVEWLDLGMPEALWVMRVRNFGPLIVSIDVRGNNLFENNKKVFAEKKEKALAEICGTPAHGGILQYMK